MGIEIYLYGGELSAHCRDGSDLPTAVVDFIKLYKDEIIFDLADSIYGPRVNFDQFILDRGL
jgi:hypothetical protein